MLKSYASSDSPCKHQPGVLTKTGHMTHLSLLTLVQYLNIYYCILYNMCTSYFVFCEHRLQITYTFSYSISNNPRYSIQTFPPRVTRYAVYYVHINSPPIKFRNWVRKKNNNIKTFQPPILYLVLPCRT